MRNDILIFLSDVNNVSKRREEKNKRNLERYHANKKPFSDNPGKKALNGMNEGLRK